jgi:subtilase family serine protease
MATLRPLPLVALAGALLFSAISPAQQAAPAARIVNPIDENQLVTLKGNVNPQANAKNDQGRVSDSFPMAGLTLVLSRAPEQQAAFDAYVQSEYEPSSPNYHHWLTPAQIGQLYGPVQSDIAAISAWLTSKGFTVTHVAADGMTISFSGTAGQVTTAFHTEIHNLQVSGKPHIANMSDPQIPAALAEVVFGIKGLHNFLPHPLHRVGSKVLFDPDAHGWVRQQTSSGARFTPGALRKPLPPASADSGSRPKPRFYSANGDFGVEEDVSPSDFASIYNLPSGWPSSSTANGTGQIITIIGTSDIDTTDVTNFKSAFGLPAGLTPVLAHGPDGDPGNCGLNPSTDACSDSDLVENSLDVEWSGAVAPGAQVVLVTDAYNSQTTPTNDPVFDGAQWAIDNALVSGTAVFGSRIVSVSYGECELYNGTSANVAYNNLWETAAGTGIAVFVATGDSGSPTCDDGGDADGNPYEAQYGLSVSGLASSPWDTAMGGTDFSWCNPTLDSSGNVQGCASSQASTYWNTSNSSSTQASAKGYVPETPWNDTCENPIEATFLYAVASYEGAGTISTPEEACNFIYQNEPQLLQEYEEFGVDPLVEFVDTVGGSGGASSCVVNSSTSTTAGTCNSTDNSTGSTYGNLTLVNDGWPSPAWQKNSGVTGTSGLTQRAIPDVSFFAGDGGLDSATLICVSNDGAGCTDISNTDSTNTGGAEGVGGTSVATPEMAGVMALINQKAGAAQGSPNTQLYDLAQKQNNSSCSAEKGSTANGCYFNDVDQGTNSMACVAMANTAEGGAVYEGEEGWVPSEQYEGSISPNCSILNGGDTIGTLSGFSAVKGYDEASGLGSLNVANVVGAWKSDAGTATATLNITTTPAASSGTITLGANVSLVIAMALTGSDGTPTGTVTVAGGGYNANATLDSNGDASITIMPGSLATGTNTLTVTYGGDSNYATTSQTLTVVAAEAVPTVTVSAPAEGNIANAVNVSVGVTGPGPIPTGSVSLTAGSYGPVPGTLSASGTASFTIPAGDLPAGTDTITATYGTNGTYTNATGTATILMVSTALATPTVKVTASPSTGIDTTQSLTLNVTVSGTAASLPTGTVTATSTNATSGSTLAGGITVQLSGGIASITVPANSLSAGTDSLSVAYSGDSVYSVGTAGSVSVTVTQATYGLSAAAASPSSVSPGGTATSAITGAASTTDYVGVVTLSSCSVTTSPANAVNLPTCGVSGTITYAGGSTDTPTGTGTATVTTFSNSSAMLDTHPFKLMYGAGGTVLAFLVFLGIPARRKNWRALLGAIVLLAGLGTLSACGGGNGGGGTQSTATSPGSYTFTVTGTGNDAQNTSESTTFTLTVN